MAIRSVPSRFALVYTPRHSGRGKKERLISRSAGQHRPAARIEGGLA